LSCCREYSLKSPRISEIFNDFRYRTGVPWTGLGYTYDWANPASRVGASEYILSPNSPYQIERVVETAEYCR